MNYCAIISEFNPFTNGHKYIIEKAKQETNLDIICLMSGNFVQRGELAILDKYSRATAAIKNGASMVLELPLIYALSSAEVFASGAIKILKQMPNVSHIAFGTELDNPQILEDLAKLKVKESQTLKTKIKEEIKKGISYSKALISALKSEYLLSNPNSKKEIEEVFSGANNILAIEYLTAIYKQKANITPIFIKRTDKGYTSNNVVRVKINKTYRSFAPASHIRSLILNRDIKRVKSLVPEETYNDLGKYSKDFYIKKDTCLNAVILNELRQKTALELSSYYDYNQSLAHLINATAKEKSNITNIVDTVSGKSFRPSRIKKLLLYPLFNLTISKYKEIENSLNSVNVLAVAENKKAELSQLKKKSALILVISNKDYINLDNKASLELNQLSSTIYNTVCSQPYTQDKTIFI